MDFQKIISHKLIIHKKKYDVALQEKRVFATAFTVAKRSNCHVATVLRPNLRLEKYTSQKPYCDQVATAATFLRLDFAIIRLVANFATVLDFVFVATVLRPNLDWSLILRLFLVVKVIEHEHPWKLVDLQENVEDVDESGDEEEKEEDLVPQDEFSCTCKRCDEDINEYYRYYYKCIDDSCDLALHKFCAELPKTLTHESHPHPIILNKVRRDWTCSNCHRYHKAGALYLCPACFWLTKDVNCVVEVDKRRIYHPSHPHPLVSLCSKPILCECNACGKEHRGVFFQCTACPNFAIHNDCAFLPKRLLIQHATNAIFSHTHPLTLSYSFPPEEIRVLITMGIYGFTNARNVYIMPI
uniref:DC1 domain-containing protein n=1 Tax=Helianthus annuus TaxID=4232 RepID=A0A251VHU3_HELAN